MGLAYQRYITQGIITCALCGTAHTPAAHAAVKALTGFHMPVREPVSTKEHPLLGSTGLMGNSPDSDFCQVIPPSALARNYPNFKQEDSIPQVETVLQDEEEEEEDESNPDDPSLSREVGSSLMVMTHPMVIHPTLQLLQICRSWFNLTLDIAVY